MTATVLHLPGGGEHHIRQEDRSHLLAQLRGRTPLTELSIDDMAVLARWCDAAITDIRDQLERTVVEPDMTKRKLVPVRQAAQFVTAYLVGTQMEIIRLLKDARLADGSVTCDTEQT